MHKRMMAVMAMLLSFIGYTTVQAQGGGYIELDTGPVILSMDTNGELEIQFQGRRWLTPIGIVRVGGFASNEELNSFTTALYDMHEVEQRLTVQVNDQLYFYDLTEYKEFKIQ